MNYGDMQVKQALDNIAALCKQISEHPEFLKCCSIEKNESRWLRATLDSCGKVSDELVAAVDFLYNEIDSLLITPTGKHNLLNRQYLREVHGIRFEKGEEDAFGPLTAIMVTPWFRVLYG